MPIVRATYLRSALVGAIGLTLGGMAGVALVFLLFQTRLIGWIARLVSASQPLVGLYIGLIGAYLWLALGAGLGMLLGGLALHRIDPGASRKRYLLGSGLAFGLAEGLLVIPIVLVLALTALYSNGVIGEINRYSILFTIFGLLFGLVAGLWLGLITVRLRRSWRVILASIVGFGLGGGLMGILLRTISVQSFAALGVVGTLIVLLLLALALYAPAGALLGLVYASNAARRQTHGDETVDPGRTQIWVAAAIGIVGLLVLMLVSNTVIDFLTVRPGSTATQLQPQTLGVHWAEPELAAAGSVLAPGAPALAANKAGQTATVWAQQAGAAADIFLRLDHGAPIDVSNDAADSWRPQVAVDDAGRGHVVWVGPGVEANATMVWYASCTESGCAAPVLLSDLSGVACADGAGSRHDDPGIAIDGAGNLMAMWSTDEHLLPYIIWPAGQKPDPETAACAPSGAQATSPRLAGGAARQFGAAFEAEGTVQALRFEQGAWDGPREVGAGFEADVFFDRDGGMHLAWCGSDGKVGYQSPTEASEQIAFPGCLNRPRLAQDAEGLMHLLWYADRVRNVNDVEKAASLLYESIDAGAAWSEPAIVAATAAVVQPAVATQPGASLYLAWQDGAGADAELKLARQPVYACSDEKLSTVESSLVEAIVKGGFYPDGFQTPYCGNAYESMIFTPNPNPAFSDSPPTADGGFDYVASANHLAQTELSFSTMQWEPDSGDLNPGTTYARSVVALYQDLKARPERYPRGLHVRMLLGNYPVVASLEWGSQIWDVMSDLREAGLTEMVNPELGWKLELANYAGVFPHSHTKFVDFDGKLLLAAGFNYGYLHFPKDHPSGRGADLVDLGLLAAGPVAQTGLAAYDDMWQGASQLLCTDLAAENWQDSCRFQEAIVSHVPEATKYFLAGDDFALSLYRNNSFKQADTAMAAAIASAERSIDIMHANFSMKLICSLAVLNKDICDFGDALQWMPALVDAIEQNQVKVRVMVESSNMNGLENRIAIKILEDELARRGLSDSLEVRFFPGRVHAKSTLIDDSLLIIGSQNYHYSAWGPGGLNEFSSTTDDADAVSTYKSMYDYYWSQAKTPEEEPWGMAN